METVRERTQRFEELMLSPYAAFSNRTKGRCKSEPDCPLRTPYQRDRDRIIHCNAFRRLKHKTQVFLSPEGDHYRTRLTHTLEVAQIARTMAVALQLNETLTEAIALGHDLGHTPFGHAGERVLHQLSPTGFCHFEQSVRVVEVLEKEGQGLNLTFEVITPKHRMPLHWRGSWCYMPTESPISIMILKTLCGQECCRNPIFQRKSATPWAAPNRSESPR